MSDDMWPPVARRWWDRLLVVWIVGSTSIVCAGLLWLLFDVFYHGLPGWQWNFLWQEPRSAGREGGIGPAVVSTLILVVMTLAISVPLGIVIAVGLVESSPRFASVVRRLLDVLAGVPSIVFGLFGNAFFSIYLGWGYSLMSGAVTLACMILPLIIRTTERSLREVPESYWQAAATLGFSRVGTLRRVILPAALPSIGAGIVLSLGRVLAETAALIFTAGYVMRQPESVWDSGRSLSVHIYDLSMNVAGGMTPAYRTAMVLVFLLLLGNSVARLVWHGRVQEPRLRLR